MIQEGDKVQLLIDKVFISGGKSKGKAKVIAKQWSFAKVIALHDDVAILEAGERFSMRIEYLSKVEK